MQKQGKFREPTAKERKEAIGNLSSLSKKNSLQLQKIIPLFMPVPLPSEDDWLFSHEELGQTFTKYSEIARKVDKQRKVIYIQPLEKGISFHFIQQLQIFASAFFYGIQVKFMDLFDISQNNIQTRIKQGNQQYNATQILNALKKKRPHDAYCTIGICLTDIYNKEEWNYVFGLASLNDAVGVFSFARYQESFFNKNAKPDEELVIYRSCKVMCHEIVHQFGIKHCIYYHCILNGSNHYEESGKKPFQLCPVCLRKLQFALEFDIAERYQALIQAASEIPSKYFSREIEIYKRLLYIEGEQQGNQK